MIDAAKYADLVLLLVDGAFGFEMETFEFLNILQVRRFTTSRLSHQLSILCMHLMSSLQTVRLTGLMALTPATMRFFLERTPDRAECFDGSINGHGHQSLQARGIPEAFDSLKDQEPYCLTQGSCKRLCSLLSRAPEH